ncbi:MAG TPA: hypothetical protein VMQ78_00600 [Candidatus Limnocylindria bacterium]|nr:hypothetical protein [Candidatus Limnocylindria bacterium]
MRRLLVGALLLILACGGAATLPAPSQPASVRSSTPIPQIDGYDMMGTFPATTFFVVTPQSVKAVALLNHATRYVIPVDSDGAQVAVAAASQLAYVMDQTAAGARLRSFDVATGIQRASRVMPRAALLRTDSAHATLAVDASTGEVFALVGHGALRAIEQFEGTRLDPVRRVLGDLVCGDRLLAAAGRLALACMADGWLITSEPGGGGKFRADAALVALAMLPDGTLMAGSADARLWRLARGAATLERLDALKERGTSLLRDGIASQGDCCFLFGVVERVTSPQVRVLAGGYTLLLFPEAERPQGGILVQPPFAYYAVGSQARHIDIQQGFGEMMADVGGRALPGAVADR